MDATRCLARMAILAVGLSAAAVQAASTDRIIVRMSEPAQAGLMMELSAEPRRGERLHVLSETTGNDVRWVRALADGAQVLSLGRLHAMEDVEAMAARLAALSGVEYAEPDMRVFPAVVPNDPLYVAQWHLHPVITGAPGARYGIDAPTAWNLNTGDAVTVAVLDTGIRFDHPDLLGKVLPGYDFVDQDSPGVYFTANDGDGRDPNAADPGDWVTFLEAVEWGCPASASTWHGTHVAGILGAASNNQEGIAGVSWGAMILPVRVLGKCGGYLSDIADGMRWAAGLSVPGAPVNPHPARILNLSLGGVGQCGSTWQNAVNAVNGAGALVVAAAGNEGANLNQIPVAPANCPGVLTVTSTTRNGERTFMSSFGSAVDISAPGNQVQSTSGMGGTYPTQNGYTLRSGTSAATPFVAGTAALMLSRNPDLGRQDLFNGLTATATPFPGTTLCATQGGCGSGVLNAGAAVAAVADAGGRPQVGGSFATVVDLAKGVAVTSNAVTVNTGGAALPVSVRGGEYSLGCTGSFTAADGQLQGSSSVCLRHTSSALPDHPAATILTVGNRRIAFVSMTGPADTTPDNLMDFPVSWDVASSALVTSALITVEGIDAPTPIRVLNSSTAQSTRYSLHCASDGFTPEPGYVAPGGSLCVRHRAAAEPGGSAVTRLEIGGVTVAFESVTLDPDSPSPGGGSGSGGGGAFSFGWFALLLSVYGLARRRTARAAPRASPVIAP